MTIKELVKALVSPPVECRALSEPTRCHIGKMCGICPGAHDNLYDSPFCGPNIGCVGTFFHEEVPRDIRRPSWRRVERYVNGRCKEWIEAGRSFYMKNDGEVVENKGL